MGQEIPLEANKDVDQDLVALFEEMLACARRGEAKGFMGVLELPGDKQRAITRGTFAKDAELAVKVASMALDGMCKRTGIAHPKVNAHCALPPRHRKA